MSSEDPYASLAPTAKLPAIRQRSRAIARVFGITILVVSLLPFAATVFLLNQELQVISVRFELVGIAGPDWLGFGETPHSLRSLLIVLACMTCTAWAIGVCLVLGGPWRWFPKHCQIMRRDLCNSVFRANDDVVTRTSDMNPYSPPASATAIELVHRNVLALVGLTLAIGASIAMILASVDQIFVRATFVAIPALFISLVALRHRPRRVAICGMLLAGFVCLHLPTMSFAVQLWRD